MKGHGCNYSRAIWARMARGIETVVEGKDIGNMQPKDLSTGHVNGLNTLRAHSVPETCDLASIFQAPEV